MKRILILATTVPGTPGDGTPSFVVDLASSLTGDMEVTVLAPRVPGSARVSHVAGVTIERFPYFFRRWEHLADEAIMPRLRAQPWRLPEAVALVLSMMWHSWRMTSRNAFDAVNAHWLVPAGATAWIVHKTRRIPYVVTVHGADAYTLNGPIGRRIKRLVLRAAHAVLPVSSEIGRIVRELGGPAARVGDVLPMGVGQRSAEPRERLRGTFLFVGRLADKKGLDIAIRALRAVPQARLRVVGDGPQRQHLDQLVDQLGLDHQIEFLGRLNRQDVYAEMARCHGLLVPSVTGSGGDQDGTPVVLAEAMSGGTTVIASDLAGLGEYVDDGATGRLVPPGDVDALAQALADALADDGEFLRLGLEGQKRFAGGPLDMRTTATEYQRVLTEVVS